VSVTGRLSIGKVFVPGGMPELTYVPRTERHLETSLAEVEDNLCKLVVVTGATKTGKTVLVRKVLDAGRPIVWIDGGLVGSESDFWQECLRALNADLILEREEGQTQTSGSKIGGSVSAKVLGSGLTASGELNEGESSAARVKVAPTGTLARRAIETMKNCNAILVVDDFHYLSRDLQGKVVRALKGEIFKGFPAVAIAIPHRRYDAVRVEREMNGRLEPIKVPEWSVGELMEIPAKGFPLLGMTISEDLTRALASEAYGSPHLMQEFCKALAKKTERLAATSADEQFTDDIYIDIAEHTGRVVFDKLASGPRQRTDRKPRRLTSGGEADIYRVVLMALSRIEPGMKRINYETLRGAIRDLLLADDVPQAHEVTRVLEKMAEIASKDEMSVKVLDWDKEEQILHVTDPFFAFFLKWARDYVDAAEPRD
jgi:hypothetical protein